MRRAARAVAGALAALVLVATAAAQDTPAGRVRVRLPQIRRCFERALRHDPNLGSPRGVRVTLRASGAVKAVVVDAPAPHDAALDACIAAVIRAIAFAPTGHGVVTIEIPFVGDPSS